MYITVGDALKKNIITQKDYSNIYVTANIQIIPLKKGCDIGCTKGKLDITPTNNKTNIF